MAIHRAGTYPVTIKTPLAPSEYSEILVSFAQGQQLVVEKKNGDTGFSTTEDAVVVVLTQAETLLFQPTAGSPMGGTRAPMAFLQIRCYKSDLDAPASAVWPIEVYDALNQEVLDGV